MKEEQIEATANLARTYNARTDVVAWPIRISVPDLKENGAQKQARSRNRDVIVQDYSCFSACPDADMHNHIYKMWGIARHRHHPRDYSAPYDDLRFLAITQKDTQRPLGGMLFRDHPLMKTFEARHFYYDVSESRRSLGTFIILCLKDYAQDHNYDYVDLGQWSELPSKTAYKRNFHPHQIQDRGYWRPMPTVD